MSFEAAAAAAGAPVVAYNIPGNVHRTLTPDIIGTLFERRTLIGVKDSSGDLSALRQLMELAGPERTQSVLTGSELLLDLALQIGADGAVAGLSNVDPATFVAALNAHRSGNAEELATQQGRALQLVDLYQQIEPAAGLNATQLGAMKLALHMRGVIEDPRLSSPMLAPSERQRAHVHSVLARLELL